MQSTDGWFNPASISTHAPTTTMGASGPVEVGLRTRLQLVSCTLMGLWLAFLPVRATAYATFGVGLEANVFFVGNVVLVLSSLLCAGVFAIARWATLSDARLKDLAVVFGVLATLLIEMNTNMLPIPSFPFRAVPWTVVWIVLFPLLIPVGSRRTLVGGLAAATATPVSFGLWTLLGAEPQPLLNVVLWSFGVYTAALVVNVPVYILENNRRRMLEAERKVRRMGSYELLEELGSGGMGEVWRGQHSLLARPAAIKIIKNDGWDLERLEAARRRFQKEAQVTATLTSPHTVSLYDFGVARNGAFYYVMELLDGVDVDHLVRRSGPQPPGRVIHLLRQACRSLAEAHRRGLVHRDIKPANLFVCRYGLERDFVKVLDFGMVKVIEQDQEPTQAGGRTGFVGTPAFMAPELTVQSNSVDSRADLYGLGCLAYWLLTGRYVFQAKTPMEMVLAHYQQPPTPPSEHEPVPAELEALVMACLEKAPEDRPKTAEVLLRKLEALGARHPWTSQDSEQWWECHRAEVGAADGATAG